MQLRVLNSSLGINSLIFSYFKFLSCPVTSCATAGLLSWPGATAGSGQTGPVPTISAVRRADPGEFETGGGGPWPCHTRSASPPSLCATRSEGGETGE